MPKSKPVEALAACFSMSIAVPLLAVPLSQLQWQHTLPVSSGNRAFSSDHLAAEVVCHHQDKMMYPEYLLDEQTVITANSAAQQLIPNFSAWG